MLLASRFGVAASTFHAGAALVVGAALADRGWRPLFGIPHDRVIAIHLHLAVIGWLTLLIVTVGRTLTPMLSLAPAEPRRRLPVEELVLTAGLWLLLLGLALGWRVASAVGALLVLGAVVAFAVLTARIGRRHRLDGLEGPLTHVVTGVFFLLQATILGLGMVFGLDPTPARLMGYVTALLLGWAAGVTGGLAAYFLLGVARTEAPLRALTGIALIPAFLPWRVAIEVLGLMGYGRKQWVRTSRLPT